MRAIAFRDEKLYRLKAEDYGDGPRRALGILLHSVAKGVGFALLAGLFLLFPRVPFRDWVELLLPVALVCTVWVAVMDRRSYIGEIEIYPDRIIRHSGEKTVGIERCEVLSIREGGFWTVFGWVNGIRVRGKRASIFIPAACADYPEIKSKLGGWKPFDA